MNEPEHEGELESRIGDALREAAINGDVELAKKATRDTFATRLFVIVAVGLLAAAIVFGYTTLKAVRATQHAAFDLSQQTRACVTPGTLCYQSRVKQDSAQTTAIVAGVIGGVNEVSIYAAWCANKPGYQTVAEIQKCVTDKIHPK